jgi:hypothetical protein
MSPVILLRYNILLVILCPLYGYFFGASVHLSHLITRAPLCITGTLGNSHDLSELCHEAFVSTER